MASDWAGLGKGIAATDEASGQRQLIQRSLSSLICFLFVLFRSSLVMTCICRVGQLNSELRALVPVDKRARVAILHYF